MTNDNYILPEKWCIRWKNKENYEVINEYLNNLRNISWVYEDDETHANAVVTYNNVYFNEVRKFTPIPQDHTEISFEQFCKYVLKEEVKQEIIIEEDMSYLIEFLEKLKM